MQHDEPWTIERITNALGNPTLSQRFLGEINKAPAHRLLEVFAKWRGISEGILVAVERGREMAAAEAAGQPLPGEWIDVTAEVKADAERLRSRHAA